jgi:hypothetical protein
MTERGAGLAAHLISRTNVTRSVGLPTRQFSGHSPENYRFASEQGERNHHGKEGKKDKASEISQKA